MSYEPNAGYAGGIGISPRCAAGRVSEKLNSLIDSKKGGHMVSF